MGPWRFVQPPGLKPLKNKYVARLLTADPDPKVPAEQHMKSIAMSAFLSGWPREHIEGILLESPVFGPRLRREPEVLADLLRDARARATPEQVDIYVEYLEADIAAARDAAQAIRWQSTEKIRVSSAATTMVLLAILTIADAAKTTTDLHLAVRRLGLASGTNRTVALRARNLLVKNRVLTRYLENPNKSRNDAYGYKLNLAQILKMAPDRVSRVDPALSELVSHEAFMRGALSPSGYRILAQLHPIQPRHTADVAQTVGLSPDWTRTKLRQLREHDLTYESAGQWRRCTNDELPVRLRRAATVLGTYGVTERRTAEYANEREHFRYRSFSPATKAGRESGEKKQTE
jgi:hypothetical protein